jgi:3',5'-cyclic AMP phosphodiesterase CpdA
MLAQISDPHINLADASSEDLAAAVGALRALRPAPEAVIVTGDIADGAFAAEYERAAALLATLPMPVHVLAGNHDDPAALDAMFNTSSFDAGGLRVVACNTALPGLATGRIDLEWLAAQIADEVPTVVAMHHPPLVSGIPALDEIGLPESDRAGLADLLRRHPHVLRVIAGHIHRGAFEVLGGCGVLTCPSTYLNAKLEIGAAEYVMEREAPAFVLHALVDGAGALVSHVQPVPARA